MTITREGGSLIEPPVSPRRIAGLASLLIVNYRSAELTAEAIASARSTTSAALEVIVVDNSCDGDEVAKLARLPIDTLIIARSNSGYAGGINLGVERCRGEFVLLSNPDVVFRPEAIDRLIAGVRDGAAMTGPKFVWDERGEWILPPASSPSLLDKLSEIASQHSGSHARRRERHILSERIRFWSLEGPTEVPALSGAVMCMRTADVARFGGFDESFRLYFEEIDFMRRLLRSGRRLEYIPGAVCRHIYNQSAGLSEVGPASYYASEMRYFEKWSGSTAVRLMGLSAENRAPAEEARQLNESTPLHLTVSPAVVLIEASPLPCFTSAAGHFPNGADVVVPAEIVSSYRQERLFIRAVRRDTLETVDSWVLRKVLK